jgi:hypothetical protein
VRGILKIMMMAYGFRTGIQEFLDETPPAACQSAAHIRSKLDWNFNRVSRSSRASSGLC